MKFSLWRQYGALNSQPVWDAFEHSVIQAGHEVVHNHPNSDVDVIWSVLWHGRMTRNREIWKRAQKNNKPIIVQHERSQQWDKLPPMRKWVSDQIAEIRTHTDRPIVFRPHPRSPVPKLEQQFRDVVVQRPQKRKGTYDDFDMRFQGAHCVVSWSSNPGPHAVIAGYPVFVGASSLAWDVGNSDYSFIESPLMPDRTQWLNDYAHTEHTLDEIRQGIPLNYLTKKLS